MNLDFERATHNIIREEILNIIQGQKVIIFGAGESGIWAKALLEEKGIEICSFCDNSIAKQGKRIDGILVRAFEDAIGLFPNACICISSMFWHEIKEQICDTKPKLSGRVFNILSTMNWETINRCFVSGEEKYIKDNLLAFEEVFDSLSDDESKRVLENLLNYRLTRDDKYIEKIKSNNKTYLDTEVLKSEDFDYIYKGLIIDGGAFDGDTVKFFLKELSDSGKKLEIHAYEVSEDNCKKIQNMGVDVKNTVKIYRRALYRESNKKISLQGSELSARLEGSTENVTDIVDTFCLDDYSDEVRISFVKLDVEGAEREVLLGSKNMLKRCKPILAISAYHLQDDIICLYRILKECVGEDYKLYMRHYLYSSGETVLYAVPINKI